MCIDELVGRGGRYACLTSCGVCCVPPVSARCAMVVRGTGCRCRGARCWHEQVSKYPTVRRTEALVQLIVLTHPELMKNKLTEDE